MLASRVGILASNIAASMATILTIAIAIAIAIGLLNCLASVKINLAQLAEALNSAATKQMIYTRRNAKPSNGDQALDGFHSVLSGGCPTVLGSARTKTVGLPSMGIWTLRHDPICAPDLVDSSGIPVLDPDQRGLIPLPHVPELVTLGGGRIATRQTAQLVPNKAFDVEAAGIVFLHE